MENNWIRLKNYHKLAASRPPEKLSPVVLFGLIGLELINIRVEREKIFLSYEAGRETALAIYRNVTLPLLRSLEFYSKLKPIRAYQSIKYQSWDQTLKQFIREIETKDWENAARVAGEGRT